MKKFTLENEVVQETLKKISDFDSKYDDLKLVVVGGMAVQAHSHKLKLYRATNDVDLMTLKNIVPKEFREGFGKDMHDYFSNNNCSPVLGKTRYGYEIQIPDDNQNFLIHLSKFSKSYLDRHFEWKSREFDNAQEISIEDLDGKPLRVHRVEDILANKARRLGKLNNNGFINDNELDEWYMFLEQDFESLGNINLESKLKYVNNERNKLIDMSRDNFSKFKNELNNYKVTKDLYDINLLSRCILEGFTKFDSSYLNKALSSIPSIR